MPYIGTAPRVVELDDDADFFGVDHIREERCPACNAKALYEYAGSALRPNAETVIECRECGAAETEDAWAESQP